MRTYKNILSFALFFVLGQMACFSQTVSARYAALEERNYTTNRASDKPKGSRRTLQVKTQQDFDNLNTSILNAFKKGYKTIYVKLSQGIYLYNEDHIFLNRIDYPDAELIIEGNNTVLVGKQKVFQRNSRKEDIRQLLKCQDECWTELAQLTAPIEIVDEKNGICRIRNTQFDKQGDAKKIELTEWFQRKTYEITRITSEHVYFKVNDLAYRNDWSSYNVNLDYAMAHQYPRYRLLKQEQSAHPDETQPSRFLWVYASKIHSIKLAGIQFLGSGYGQESLLYMSYTVCGSFEISKCSFECLRNEAVRCVKSDNLYFHHNTIKGCYAGAVLTDNASSDIIITNNRFEQIGLNGGMNYVVTCYGKDFLIKNNIFKDFNYVAINSGIRLNWEKNNSCSGIIEYNELFYSQEFIDNKWKYTLIDGGAIYVDCIIDHIIIRYNFIHDYAGMGHNRGIYCDDGAGNVDIYGNVIVNIHDGETIFSWRAKGTEKKYKSANNNINVMYNIIDGGYTLEEIDNSSCMKGMNIILKASDNFSPKLLNFSIIEPDIPGDDSYAVKGGKLSLSKNDKTKVEQLLCYEKLKYWLQ